MKVVKAEEMGRLEKSAYETGASEEDFMNSAGSKIADAIQAFIAKYHLKPHILLLCGKGNNAGDAFVAGRLLKQKGEFHVQALSLSPKEESSPLCQLQSSRFGAGITYLTDGMDIDFRNAALLVDGLFGTGFKGEVTGLYRKVIEKANASGLPILSIDIPSGINGTTGEMASHVISATETVFLGLPKTGCFLGEAWNHVGLIKTVDFGLNQSFVERARADFQLLEEGYIKTLLPRLKRNGNKYTAGYVVGFGGSLGMPGSVLLTSKAALRAGAGIVRLLHPEGMEAELASAPYELIREGHEGEKEKILFAVAKAKSHFVGPGMGRDKSAKELLKAILSCISKPCVIDADALTLLAENFFELPKDTILTPHHGEMMRLLGLKEEIPVLDFLKRCEKFAEEKKVVLVLKGAPTFIFVPGEQPAISPRGDPGMATAGTGDVLTGIIATFLAQGKNLKEAAYLGVYIHQMAGEEAAFEKTSYSMMAGDLIEALPAVFKKL